MDSYNVTSNHLHGDSASLPMIGKDVLESLTTAMYEDCKFIFREYIQNSADAIDKAIANDLIKRDDHSIWINIDPSKRSITFEDNGTGLSESLFKDTLQNIAVSQKDKENDKGFRGIGRLGGIGYCESLIFESSAYGEKTKSIMVWDAKQFKSIIGDHKNKQHASIVIDQITSTYLQPEQENKHYFKVILNNVTSNELLDTDTVRSYLSMVAPVPYPTGFIFRSLIHRELIKENLHLDEYNIFLNGDLLNKLYTSALYSCKNSQKQRVDEIFDVHFFKDYDSKGSLLYWGWYGVSTFNKAIEKPCNPAWGIRLRKYNIQIGLENTLLKLHREERGNSYFFGEIHAFHSLLIPNARRDYFSENEIAYLFEQKVRHFFHKSLYRLYYDASKIRTAFRDLKAYDDLLKSYEEKEKSNFISKTEERKLREKIEATSKKAEEATKRLTQIEQKESDPVVRKIFDKVKKNNPGVTFGNSPKEVVPDANVPFSDKKKATFFTDKYSWLPKSERKLLSRVYEVIDNVLSKDVSNDLIKKIDEEICSRR